MSDPLGYNPIGESAPGLPRHDAGLPGHVSGQYTPIATDNYGSPAPGYGGGGYAGGGGGYTGGGGYPVTAAESAFGKWFGRIITLGTIALILPVQVVLYPIAGLAAVAGGGATYVLLQGVPMTRDVMLSWAWWGAFIVFLPVMRLENDITDRVPLFGTIKHVLRLALIGAWFYYFNVYSQMNTPQSGAIVAVVVAVLAHFLLRWDLIRGLWHALLHMTWLRSTD